MYRQPSALVVLGVHSFGTPVISGTATFFGSTTAGFTATTGLGASTTGGGATNGPLKFAAGSCSTTGCSAQPTTPTRATIRTKDNAACLAIHGPIRKCPETTCLR